MLLVVFSLPLTKTFAETSLDFEIIPMHYGLLNAEPMTINENSQLTSFTLADSANKGDTQITLTGGGNSLNPSELFVYIATSGVHYVAQVKTITNNVVELMKPLEEDVSAGDNIWNFYNDAFHPNFYGFIALGDYALDRLKGENLSNKTHAFIGDSWFDNDMLVPHLGTKLNASQIINKGVGGRNTIDVLNTFDAEFPSGAASQPDYFWVLLGTNDWDDDTPANEYISNLEQIIQKINDRGAKAIVFTSSVGPSSLATGNTPTFKSLSHKYANALLALKQVGGDEISATLNNDDLIIEFSTNSQLNTNSHYMFFIDIDNNANTGYRYSQLWQNSGSDYMVQNGFLYKSRGNDWEWDQIGSVATVGLNKVIIKKSDINFNKGTIKIGALIISNDWRTTEDYFPKTTEMKQVTLNVVKPPVGSKELTATVKDNNLVVEYTSTTTFSADSHFLVFIDSDNNAGTGYDSLLWSGSGADYLVQNNFVYKSLSNDSNWEWEDQNSVVSFERNKVVVSLDDLGLGNLTSDRVIKVGVLIVSNDWNTTEEYYPKSGNMKQITIDGSGGTQLKALKDTATTKAGMSVTINVLANDIGTGLTIDATENPNNGSASISNNLLIYTPDAGFSGVDTFRYKIADSSGQTAWGEIEVTVTAVNNDPLKANKDTATVKSGGSVLIDVLANDTGSGLDLCCVDYAWTGTTSLVGGKVKYQSDGSYIGEVKFWYDITDEFGDRAWASVTVTITE